MSEKIKVNIIKSKVPIIWLDTSIITYMTQWKNNLCKLDSVQEKRIEKLYNAIHENTRKGKLICPFAEQELEIWCERDKWLNTIYTLSLDIKTLGFYKIHDNQFYTFAKSFINNESTVILNYTDCFFKDPAEELKERLSQKFFITLNIPLYDKDIQKNQKNELLQGLNEQREKNIKNKVSFKKQLEAEYLGELQAKLIMITQYFLGKSKNNDDSLKAIFSYMDIQYQLSILKDITGNPNDYIDFRNFYNSSYYRAMPYTNLSSNLMAELMISKQPIKSGDVMDISHISTIMPYSNIFITDRAWSTFLRNKKLDKLYNTIVCYIGDEQIINDFFKNI